MKDEIENRARRLVKARMMRGKRAEVAKAAKHTPGWVSHWIKGVRVQHATIDEISAMLGAVGVPLDRVSAPIEVDDLDWEVFGLMGRLSPRQKAVARYLVAGLTDGDVAGEVPPAARQPTPKEKPGQRQAVRKAR